MNAIFILDASDLLVAEDHFILHQFPPSFPKSLKIYNINAVSINSTRLSVLITWDTIQRMRSKKFCKIWRNGVKRQLSYTWKLQILKWTNWTTMYHHVNYTEINKMQHYSSNEPNGGMYVDLTKIQCTNKSLLLTDLSPHAYYKFQIVVNKIKRSKNSNRYDQPQNIAGNGSNIHYFGNQS